MSLKTLKDYPLTVVDRFEAGAVLFFNQVGILFLNIWDTLVFIAQGKVDWRKTIYQTATIGFDSLPMALLICLIAGSVLSLQTAEKFAQTGADAYVGGLVALAIVREIAPIFACL